MSSANGINVSAVFPPFCAKHASECIGLIEEGIPGESLLIVERLKGGFACIHTVTRQSVVSGLVAVSNTTEYENTNVPSLSYWRGKWTQVSGSAVVDIRAEQNGLFAEGDATWTTPNGQVTNGGYFVRQILPYRRFAKTTAVAAKDDCEINFTLLDEVLVLVDNHQCGGENVSFSGFYRK